MPVSSTITCTWVGSQRTRIVIHFRRVSDGVADQVDQHLRRPIRIGVCQHLFFRRFNRNLQALLEELRSKVRNDTVHQRHDIEVVRLDCNLPCFHTREVLKIIDQFAETPHFVLHGGDCLRVAWQHAVEQSFQVPFQTGERRAQFVRYIADQGDPLALNLRQRLRHLIETLRN